MCDSGPQTPSVVSTYKEKIPWGIVPAFWRFSCADDNAALPSFFDVCMLAASLSDS